MAGGFLLVIAAVIGWLAAWAVIAAVLYFAIARAFKISDYSSDEIANAGDMHPPLTPARRDAGGWRQGRQGRGFTDTRTHHIAHDKTVDTR